MLPTKRTDALAPRSIADYVTLAAREPALPPTVSDFLDLLSPLAKDMYATRQAALSAAIRHMQAGAPEGPSIHLWLLTSYAPALQALAVRYRKPSESLDEAISAAIWAFLETLHGMGEARLNSPWLAREIERDTKDRLRVMAGVRDYQQAGRLEATPDDALMEDRVEDEREDAYQALEDMIQDMPVTEAERGLLAGLYVYGYSLHEMAVQLGQDYRTVRQRHLRLMNRLRKNLGH